MKYPPGPRGLEVFGFVKSPLTFLANSSRKYGPISSFNLLGQRIYFIDDPELIAEVLVTRQHLFERDNGATLLRELVGDSMITRDEPAHRQRRRTLQPAFHRAQVASYTGMMVEQCRRSMADWSANSRFDIALEMKRLTISIVGASLFGTDFRESAERIALVLGRAVQRARWLALPLFYLEPLALGYRRRFPHGRSLFFQSERMELERILKPLIDRSRAGESQDILSLLLDQLDYRDAMNEIVTLVLAGHETTAMALSWCWHLIAGHPDVEERMHKEIDEVLDGREATFEHLARLNFTGMVFAEAMRLYPPGPAFGRRPKESVTLGGYQIPASASVMLSPYVTHRNERFFARPDQFEPERWQGISIPKFAYFPFGGGAKMCIGDTFSRMEGVLVLATIGRKWRLVADNAGSVGFKLGITLRPDRPVWMRPEARTR